MGRTGRKRTGGVLVLVTEGKEANKWEKANDNYRWIQGKIALGTDFQYAVDLSPRIIPAEIEPTCEKKFIEPPTENLEPAPAKEKQSRVRKKAPPRKFHMPDGVETGFTTASKLGGFKSASKLTPMQTSVPADDDDNEDDFLLEDVNEEVSQDLSGPEAGLLTASQEDELKRLYRTVYSGDDNQIIGYPQLDAFPTEQRKLSRTVHVKHGRTTKSFVNMIRNIHSMDDYRIEQFRLNLRPEDKVNIPPTPSRHVPSSPFAVVINNNNNHNRPTINTLSNTLTGPAASSISKLAAFRAPGLLKKTGLSEGSPNVPRLSTTNSHTTTSTITTNGFTSARSMMEDGSNVTGTKQKKKLPSAPPPASLSSSPSPSSPDPYIEKTSSFSSPSSKLNQEKKKRERAESEESDDLPTASQLLGRKKPAITSNVMTATTATTAIKRKSMTAVENEKPKKKVQVLQRGRQKVISDSEDEDDD